MKTAALLLKYILGLKSYVAAENTHKMSIEEDNPSICPDCGFCADNGGALAQHSQHWHGEIQRCPHCRFTSNQVKLLMSHALKIHRDDEPFACQYKDARYKCDYEAKAKNVLNKHVKICHLKEKPFQCQYCQYRASLKGSVKKHEEICPKGPKDQSRKTKDPPEMRFVDIEQVYQQDLAHFDQELLSDDEAFDVLEDDSGGEEKNDVEMLETDLEVEAEPPSTTSAQKAMHSEAFTPENFESTTSTVKPEVKLESAGDHPCDEEDVLPNDPDEDGDFDHASEKLAQPSADYIDDLACGRCGYVAVSRYLLERHSKMKHPVVKNKKKYVYEKKFKCDECDMKCESKKRLEHHIEVRHRKVRSFICDLCGIETKSEKSLTTHRLQKHEHKPFFCQEPGCTFRSNCKYSLKEHNRAIHEEAKDNVCHVCGKGYSRASSLKSHYRFVHMKDYRHQCPQCNYGACTPAQLQNHVTSVHLKIRNISCELCDFKCSSKGSLLAHMRFTHGQGEKVKCSHCEKLFWSNSCLRKHINNVHLKILKHHCPDCDFKTASSSALKKHIERQVCKLQRKKGKKSKAEKERLLLFAGN